MEIFSYAQNKKAVVDSLNKIDIIYTTLYIWSEKWDSGVVSSHAMNESIK